MDKCKSKFKLPFSSSFISAFTPAGAPAWRFIYSGCRIAPVARPSAAQKNWLESNMHHHSCMDIMVVLRGKGWYGLDGKVFTCAPGTVFVFQPRRKHPCGYPPTKSGFDHLWIGILQDSVFTRMVSGRSGKISYVNDMNVNLTLEQCGLARPLLNYDAPDWEYEMRLVSIIAGLLASIAASARRDEEEAPDKRKALAVKIDAIRRHIADTGGADAALEHLAHLAGYSKFHFLRVFKEHTGETVHDYVDQCRAQKAKALSEEGLSMKEIAARLNFSSSSSFSHWQRKKNINFKRMANPHF